MYKYLPILFLLINTTLFAQQKKPLTHQVYDGWKTIGERIISNDGKYVCYAINPQEGDGNLIVHNLQTNTKKTYDRGYSATFSHNSQFVYFKIKPVFAATRQAKIKKKKPDDMPKDSFAIATLGTDSITKIPLIKNYKTPDKENNWVAYLAEKPIPEAAKKKTDSLKLKIDGLAKLADSLIRKSLDSVKGKIEKQALINAAQKAVSEIYKNADNEILQDAEGDDATADKIVEGTELTIKNIVTYTTKQIKLVSDYYFDIKGTKLVIKTTKNSKDSNSKALVLLYHLQNNKVDTIMKGFNEAKNFAFSEDGAQLYFVAERDSATKALQKFYKLWYYNDGGISMGDTAIIALDKTAENIPKNYTISEHADIKFSKDGETFYFGIAPIVAAKDTNLVDFELARLDVWHYQDDYLQPQQLKELAKEQKRSYTAVINADSRFLVPLGSDSTENITLVNEGNANYVLAQSTKNNRVAAQWEGNELNTAYIIYTNDGSRKLIAKNTRFRFRASPMGKYIFWYNDVAKQYFTYEVATSITKNITKNIKVPLYDTENDVPENPDAIGITGWLANDKSILINDEYDIWQVDPQGIEKPLCLTKAIGRKTSTRYNYIITDADKRFFTATDTILLSTFNKQNKMAGFATMHISDTNSLAQVNIDKASYTQIIKAKNANQYLFTKSSIASAELYSTTNFKTFTTLTNVSNQQAAYNWLTAELVKWKMLDGKMSEGILYKPENFDPNRTKKYPILFYFYERNADKLYNYLNPAPSASTINIPYFTSNGYLVFDPNIYYKTGEPGQSAYNSVVSAAKMLSKMPWVDSTRMGIQGQSWGGYQVAYLVTRTNIFRAAGAGAPVSNMTSAYGGIRWGSGLNRQFQYEKQQSRIGANLWQRQDLYIKNSPLFFVDKIKTPLLIMHNDADGAVPWYQGIEMFTAMRRLSKPVWMLQYNGEDHNLLERKNRKDLSIRLAQFFDYWLKDAKPAEWIKVGVPALKKGIDWGVGVLP